MDTNLYSVKDSDDSCCSSIINHPSDHQACNHIADSLNHHQCPNSSFHHHNHHDAPCLLQQDDSSTSSTSNTSSHCCQCDHRRPEASLITIDNDEDQTSCSHASTYHNTDHHHHSSTPRKKKRRHKKSSSRSTSRQIDSSKDTTLADSPVPRTAPTTKTEFFEDDHLPLGGQYCSYHSNPATTESKRQRKCVIAKGLVYIVFLMIILGGIATFFCWPRTPMVVVGSHAERQNAQQGTTWATTLEKRPWMEATWLMNITLDNRDNWIPTRLTRMEMTMVDSLTQNAFATASLDDLALAPKTLVVLPNIVFHARYSARSDSDTTWQDLYRACGPQQKQGADRPSLNINMKIVFHFLGIIWTSTVNASPPSGGFLCPS
ncbi:hypothetical protein BCR42DRAFT_449866 [Absidia repens]|uniref:Uncharacterized protein n=1 Tax=Absidia repens TaxID=90262 RepID=A0A1X2ILQ9_9FUNG|nr:hypothetical protein BCR42DRAFT_449866 [Absidia repens]